MLGVVREVRPIMYGQRCLDSISADFYIASQRLVLARRYKAFRLGGLPRPHVLHPRNSVDLVHLARQQKLSVLQLDTWPFDQPIIHRRQQ